MLLDDPQGLAEVLAQLGAIRHLTGDYGAATDAFGEALELWQRLDSVLGQANAPTALGILRECGSRGEQAWALNQHAAALSAAGRDAEALAAYGQAMAMNREVGQPDDEATACEGLGELLLRRGRAAEGRGASSAGGGAVRGAGAGGRGSAGAGSVRVGDRGG